MSLGRIAAAALVLVLLLAACGRRGEEPGVEASPSPTPATEEPGEREPDPGAPGGPGGYSAPGASPTAPAPTEGAPLEPASIRPSAPGRYSYDEAGSRTFDCGTPQTSPPPSPTSLGIDPASGNRQQALRDRRASDGQGMRITTVFEFRTDGIYLAFLRQEQFTPLGPDITEFEPSPPVLAMPASPAAGQTWSFTLASKDGRINVAVDNLVEAVEEGVQLGDGSTSPATRLRSTRRASGQSNLGTVDVTENALSWISLRDRLVVRESSEAAGTVGVCKTSSKIDTLIRSSRAS